MGIPLNLYSQKWQWLYPYPTSNTIIDFSFVDKSTGFLIAENGEILKTVDCGLTWQAQNVENMELIDIFSLNTDETWVLAEFSNSYSDYGVIVTRDAGASWKVNSSLSSSNNLKCIYVLSANVGWVGGTYGMIKQTIDGGKTWIDKSLRSIYSNLSINYIHFADQKNGVILGSDYDGAVFGKTGDGGLNWKFTSLAVRNTLYSGCFAGKDNFFCVGERGLILNSKDNGLFWSFPGAIIPSTLSQIAFSDSLHGWAVGEDSTILNTINGGASWTEQQLNISTDCAAVQFIDENTGWILGTNNNSYYAGKRPALLFTDNAGSNWANRLKSLDQDIDIVDVCFIDSTLGWMISRNSIYHSYDAGRSWTRQYDSGSDYDADQLRSICFVDSMTGFCAGYNYSNYGRLLKTSNGGKIWTAKSLAIGLIRDIYFLSNMVGWIVGSDGLLARTINGGDSFELMTTNIPSIIVRVYFTDENTGWAVTNSNILLRTVDGGQNWLISYYKENTDYGGQAIYFCDKLKGFIGTGDGLYATTDGGRTFNQIKYSGSRDITDIQFSNKLEGWITTSSSNYSGQAGAVYHTLDGGMTWQLMINSGQQFLALSCVPDGYVWFVGAKSTIAK